MERPQEHPQTTAKRSVHFLLNLADKNEYDNDTIDKLWDAYENICAFPDYAQKKEMINLD